MPNPLPSPFDRTSRGQSTMEAAFERLYRNVVLAAAESDDPVGHALAAQTLKALRGSLVPSGGDSGAHEESL